jgi:hypothetical protein
VPSASTLPGFTVREIAARFRVSPDRVRRWIRTGQLSSINTADRGTKPRFIVTTESLARFEARRQVATPPVPTQQRKKRIDIVDYYP